MNENKAAVWIFITAVAGFVLFWAAIIWGIVQIVKAVA